MQCISAINIKGITQLLMFLDKSMEIFMLKFIKHGKEFLRKVLEV